MSGHVFVSYVREDAAAIRRLVSDLEEKGLSIWLDRNRLAAGERWRDAIRTAIRDGYLFLACFSRAYASRHRTHMNEELTLAIDELRLRPTARAWFVPVVINEGEVPDRVVGAGESLRDLQWVNLDEDWPAGVEMIASAAFRAVGRGKGDKTLPLAAVNRLDERGDPLRALGAQPALLLTYRLRHGSRTDGPLHQELRILLTLTNDGFAAATMPYVRIDVKSSHWFSIEPAGVTSREREALLQFVPEVQTSAVSLVGRSDFVVYSRASFQVAELSIMIEGNMATPTCEIRYTTASAGSPLRNTILQISVHEIAAFLNRSVEPAER